MTESQEHSRLKPLIPRDRPFQSLLTKSISQEKTFVTFSKKYYKYIKSLDVEWQKSFSKLFKFTKRFKRIFYLSLISSPLIDHPEFTALMQKIVKPHTKYLKNIQGGFEDQDIQELLPLLISYKFNPWYSSWRVLTSRSAYRFLSFDFVSDTTESFNKYKSALSRSLPKMRNLQYLDIKVLHKNVELIIFLLEFLNRKEILKSLKDIQLIITSGVQPAVHPDRLLAKKPEVNQALEKLVILRLDSKEWFSFLISAGKFRNLYKLKLELQLSLKEGPWNFEHLSYFHEMIELRNFTFVLLTNSVNCEKELFHHLTLPPVIYKLSFVLRDFPWNEIAQESDSLYAQFLVRIRGNHSLSDLNLGITGSCSYMSDRFAWLFIQCFTELETVRYFNSDPASFGYEQSISQTKPLIFQDFWRAFKSSQETLCEIRLCSSEITFSEQMSVLETEFPRLENLNLESRACCVANLGTFWRNLPCLRSIKASDLMFRSQEGLKEFLNDLEEISGGRSLVLDLNVENIQQKFLIDCLGKFIEEVKVKGNFYMTFKNVDAEDIKSYSEILRLVVKKGCFSMFKMDTNSETLFYVSKHEIIRMTNELAGEYEKINSC